MPSFSKAALSAIELRSFLDPGLPDRLAQLDPVIAPAVRNAEHAVDRDNRLQKPLGSGQGQKAQWDRRDRPDLSCRDDSAHAGDGVRSGCVDSAKAAMRARAAQDRGMQHALAPQIADKFAAAAQKAQILDSLDRAADVKPARHPRPAPGQSGITYARYRGVSEGAAAIGRP
jgi:hypothetical protein